ncbi:C39 family peptidase [Amycolatopsis sp. H20-H5]|uniref:C39 family peptidase n=1 Tax=Amycolatopsis sp. H20-H5 TaxID=3046309 RepID=UPI002DBB3419|nr:C39 family peptidase [Amycolatopsis sp. H20-H5]MEC3982166.1 C39 family peptidase [Amycolatopsis sp. H20-H5]
MAEKMKRRRLLGVMAGVAAIATTTVLAGGASAQAATAKTVPVTWAHQTQQYNCGPAATRIAISTHLRGASLPSMATIGAYEGTSSSTGTDRYHVRKGLAHWVPSASYEVVSIAHQGGYFTAAEARLFHDHLVFDVNRESPAVVNIVVERGGIRPPGWTNTGAVDHWVVVNGYDGKGNVLVTDPASTGHGFNPHPSYWVPLGTLDKLVRKTYIW